MGTKAGFQADYSPLMVAQLPGHRSLKYIRGGSTFKSHCSHQISNMITLTSTMDRKGEGYNEE